MIVDFEIHGMHQEVRGKLNLQDAPVPQIGWEVSFDYVSHMTVVGVHGYYGALGEQSTTLALTVNSEYWTPESIVEFLHDHPDLDVFSDVELGDFCFCHRCPNER